MNATFYEMAQQILGQLPPTANWIYTITALILFVCVIFILLIPIIIISKKVGV